MCNYSAKLIAWLDHELPENEASDLEQHVQGCAQCRSLASSYEAASDLFNAYREEVMALQPRQKMPVWTPVAVGAALTAAMVMILFVFLPARDEQTLPHPAVAAAPQVVVPGPELTAAKKSQRRQRLFTPVKGPRQAEQTSWPSESAIQVTIPADAMFPPGAVPEGVNFVADINIAADGLPDRLQLQP
jgi:anti-sigma factor RsiW